MSRLEELQAEAETPDGNLHARIHGRHEVTSWISPRHYEGVSEGRLSSQLSALARLLFAARMRAYYVVRSEDFGQVVTKEPALLGRLDQEYADRRESLTVTGEDRGGWVSITSTGMTSWAVTLSPGVLQQLDAASFSEAVGQAASELVAEQLRATRALKTAVYAGEDAEVVLNRLRAAAAPTPPG